MRRRLVQSNGAQGALTFSELHGLLASDHGGLRYKSAAMQLMASLVKSGTALLESPGISVALRARHIPGSGQIAFAVESAHAPEPQYQPQKRHLNTNTAPPRRRDVSSGDGGLEERVLVRELLFVMQNIDGRTLKWDQRRDSFVLPAGSAMRGTLAADVGAFQLTGRLSELGWLFRQVAVYIKGGHEACSRRMQQMSGSAECSAGEDDVSVRFAGGLVAQAFKHALQVELDEWYHLLALLDEQRKDELTLLQLLAWSTEPMQRLLIMAQLTRRCGHLKGGAMTVAIERQERHGDPAVSGFVRHLLRAACTPLFTMLRKWLLYGEITDQTDEFFIEQRAVPLSQLWEARYTLREAMLPCFLPRRLALEILNVGKTLNFIRHCCSDMEWNLRPKILHQHLCKRGTAYEAGGSDAEFANALADGIRGQHETKGDPSTSLSMASFARLEYGKDSELQVVVRLAADLANTRLIELLMKKYQLRQHMLNLHQYVLLGKGDFVQSLMEHLAPQLTRPSNQLHRHHIFSLVESAVRLSAPVAIQGSGGSGWVDGCMMSTSPSGGDDSEHALLLRHLDIRLRTAPGSLGWDAFCLDYDTGSPCNVVFSEAAMRLYRQASSFLWRLKRVEYSLTAVWRKHCTAVRLVHHLHKDTIMHSCHLLRNEMVHLVSNLQYYLMFEVIECAWVALNDAMSDATDLEQVLGAHNTFLADIERKAMLRSEDEEMALALKALFDSILQFTRSQDALYMSLLEQKAARNVHISSVPNTSDTVDAWGADGDFTAAHLGDVVPDAPLGKQLAASALEYRGRFALFSSLVQKHSLNDLSFLCLRLDFNDYYESFTARRHDCRETCQSQAAGRGLP